MKTPKEAATFLDLAEKHLHAATWACGTDRDVALKTIQTVKELIAIAESNLTGPEQK